MPAISTPAGIKSFLLALTLRATTDKTSRAEKRHRNCAAACQQAALIPTLAEQLFSMVNSAASPQNAAP